MIQIVADRRQIHPQLQECDGRVCLYALAFASRTRLPVKRLVDEKDYFEFFPLQVIRAKSVEAAA